MSEPAGSTSVRDVEAVDFEDAVLARSHEVPVVVDFWAAWCGPCRTLGPLIEDAVSRRGGAVELAKVDVDRAQQLAARFGVRGIPAVKAFRDGEIVGEFVGAQPAPQIEAFLDQVVPSEADRLTDEAAAVVTTDPNAAERALRRALGVDADHRDAALALADLIADRDPDAALDLVRAHRPHADAERIAARVALAAEGGDVARLRESVAAGDDPATRLELGRALAAQGEHEAAVDELLEVVRSGGDEAEAARRQILDIFTVAGDDAPFVADARRRLASALY